MVKNESKGKKRMKVNGEYEWASTYYSTRGWPKNFTNTTDAHPHKVLSKVVLPNSNLRNLRL